METLASGIQFWLPSQRQRLGNLFLALPSASVPDTPAQSVRQRNEHAGV
jgi:hypothetical protein